MQEQKNIEGSLQEEIAKLRQQLDDANDIIEAIKTGQVDALIVGANAGNEIYTLQSADQAYRIFIERMTEGALTLNKEGIILYCNSNFASMTGRELYAVIGMPFISLVASESIGKYKKLMQDCLFDDCRSECFLLSESGSLPVQLSFASLQGDEKNVFSIIVTDLTSQNEEREKLAKNNQALEESNRALATSNMDLLRFASVASHDLQEPVRKIQVFSTLLHDIEYDRLQPESKNYLQKVMRSASRMKALITNMLDYSSVNTTGENFTAIDLNDLINEVRDDLELKIQETHATVTAENLPCIRGNKGLLRQVFQNIISNSIKFARPDLPPVINVTATALAKRSFDGAAKKDGRFVLISIKDNGIGFDNSYAENIFGLFARLNSKDKYEGSGIGLSIAKKIIENHKGLITAKSNINEGAEFLIILPLQ